MHLERVLGSSLLCICGFVVVVVWVFFGCVGRLGGGGVSYIMLLFLYILEPGTIK